MTAAYDRSRSGIREGADGLLLPEVDPTDATNLDVQKVTQPERRLLFAILADAIVRVRRLATAPRQAMIELREAERWIRSDDREWPCSFVNVCEALDIEPAPLRRAVLAWGRTSDGRANVTRRALTAKKTRKRSAGAVTACVGAGAAESEPAALASSATEAPEAAVRGPRPRTTAAAEESARGSQTRAPERAASTRASGTRADEPAAHPHAGSVSGGLLAAGF